MRVVVQIRGSDCCLRLAPAVAIDVVAVGLRRAVVRFGQPVEVVVGIAPGLGCSAYRFGLAAASALVVDCVDVVAERRGVEQVLFLLEAAVLEPALRGALARVQALLDEAAVGEIELLKNGQQACR